MSAPAKYGLENHGLKNLETVHWNLSPAELIEHTIKKGQGNLSKDGSLIVYTGEHTGRSAKDKFTAKESSTEENIWWGDVNVAITEADFDKLHQKMIAFYDGREAYVQDVSAASHPKYNLKVRVITEQPSHNMFAWNMFLRTPAEEREDFVPEFTVMQAPSLTADPATDGTRTGTFIVINFAKKLVLIGGTLYAGEIKKSIFTALNYTLTDDGVLPMHCSATADEAGKVALFFGLSGTGKTTLSSDEDRALIGDDEHGWGADGVFNFEGGCYAKTIRLNPKYEPLIFNASQNFGAMLENVGYDEVARTVDWNENKYTENTRSSYPIHFLPNIIEEGHSGHPEHVFFLTADAFGVLPPISKLTPEQAYYYFLAGYTAKVAGTEKGLGKEPQATFSACFGAPFLPRHPKVYADLLKEKVQEHNAQVWLINTGWSGGPYGVGDRIHLPYTRAMVKAAMNNDLNDVAVTADPVFGLFIPATVPGVPTEILTPRNTWEDKAAYDVTAKGLVDRFHTAFAMYKGVIPDEVFVAGPQG